MNWIIYHITGSRGYRHILFWVCWVMGFTFIQSFGQPVEIYFGWFSYYVITLPVFVGHTYPGGLCAHTAFFKQAVIPVVCCVFPAVILRILHA